MESVLNCCRLRSPSINSSPATPLLLFHSSSFSSPLSKKTPFSVVHQHFIDSHINHTRYWYLIHTCRKNWFF
ncbi:hypothetical protein AAC387_Pa03g0546 [Persea americana]